MSASLVGSEMCIRDSRMDVPTYGALKPRKIMQDVSAVLKPVYWTDHKPCLLYTSDAADDM
eukprot:467345-Alexandrium_andersonii.AAC.1